MLNWHCSAFSLLLYLGFKIDILDITELTYSLPHQLVLDSKDVTDKKEICNTFNDHFMKSGFLFGSMACMRQSVMIMSPLSQMKNGSYFQETFLSRSDHFIILKFITLCVIRSA